MGIPAQLTTDGTISLHEHRKAEQDVRTGKHTGDLLEALTSETKEVGWKQRLLFSSTASWLRSTIPKICCSPSRPRSITANPLCCVRLRTSTIAPTRSTRAKVTAGWPAASAAVMWCARLSACDSRKGRPLRSMRDS